jgi:hypothetical protein
MIDISNKTNEYQDIFDSSYKIRNIVENAGNDMIPVGDNDQDENQKQTMKEYWEILKRIGADDEECFDLKRWLIFPEGFMDDFAQTFFYRVILFGELRAESYEDYKWPLDFIDWNEATDNLFECISYNKFDWNGETFIAIYDWESCI